MDIHFFGKITDPNRLKILMGCIRFQMVDDADACSGRKLKFWHLMTRRTAVYNDDPHYHYEKSSKHFLPLSFAV